MVHLDKIQSFGFQFFLFPSFQFCLSEQNLILCCRITNMNDKTYGVWCGRVFFFIFNYFDMLIFKINYKKNINARGRTPSGHFTD
jgi:hypothetical protein